jgi:protein-tyrosine-phosphatase
MAEGFARTYGMDVLVAQSAGLAPAMSVAPLTHKVMLEKNIDLGDLYPKEMQEVIEGVGLVINMSGWPLPLPLQADVVVEEWNVHDPIGEAEDVYRAVRDQIEQQVRDLIERLHSRKAPRGGRRNQGRAGSIL